MTLDGNLIQGIMTMLIAALAYFLRQKDEKQGKDIEQLSSKIDQQVELLWQKHDADAQDLSELRLHIASQHYVKTELDNRFDKMELAFKHGFHELGDKLDKLTNAVIERGIKS